MNWEYFDNSAIYIYIVRNLLWSDRPDQSHLLIESMLFKVKEKSHDQVEKEFWLWLPSNFVKTKHCLITVQQVITKEDTQSIIKKTSKLLFNITNAKISNFIFLLLCIKYSRIKNITKLLKLKFHLITYFLVNFHSPLIKITLTWSNLVSTTALPPNNLIAKCISNSPNTCIACFIKNQTNILPHPSRPHFPIWVQIRGTMQPRMYDSLFNRSNRTVNSKTRTTKIRRNYHIGRCSILTSDSGGKLYVERKHRSSDEKGG